MGSATTPLTLDQFLHLTLPQGGNYFVCYTTIGGKFIPVRCSTLGDTALEIRKHAKLRQETWVGIGSFGNRRTDTDAKRKLAFYCDIDCGPEKQYDNKKDAVEALKSAVRRSQDPIPSPTIILDSGNGFHLYWVLEVPISPQEWRDLAMRLRTALAKANLKVDDTVTTDVARILRPPETWNVKDPNNHLPVKVLRYEPKYTYTREHFYLVLPPADDMAPPLSASQSASPTKVVMPGDITDLTDGINLSPFSNLNDTEKKRVVGDMLGLLSKPKYYDKYDPWMKIGKGLMDAADMCSAPDARAEWRDIWDKWSQQSKKYDAKYLDKKWHEQFPKMKDTGFGSLVFLAKEEGFVFPNAVRNVCYPDGYIATDFGTVRQAREGEDHATLIFRAHLLDLFTSYHQDRGQVIEGTLYFPHSGHTTHLQTDMVSLNNASGMQGLASQLGRANIRARGVKQLAEIGDFVDAFMTQITAASKSLGTAVNSFGWAKEEPEQNKPGEDAFCVGSKIHWASGRFTLSGVQDKDIRELYSPHGSFVQWQKMFQTMLDQKRQEINLVLATPFAAPLLNFTSIHGLVISIVSRDSGTGKTTALRAAQSVWGQPQGGICALDDTVNAVTRRLEILRNLPAYWDELRMREQAREFIRLVFQLSQGKGKSRMNSAAVLQKVGQWRTIITVAGNEPLTDLINNMVGSTNAGMLRLMEIEAHHLPQSDVAHHLQTFRGLDTHYGHGGERYAKWLAQNTERAERITKVLLEKFDAKLNATNEERFWLAGIAALAAGAHIATNELKLVRFDMGALTRYLCDVFLDHRDKTSDKTSDKDAINLLRAYISDRTEWSIRTSEVRLPGKRGRPALVDLLFPITSTAVKHPLSYQYGRDDSLLMVSELEFAKWLENKRQISKSVVLPALEKLGMRKVERATLGAGSPSPDQVRSTGWLADTTDPAFSELIGE